MIDVLAWAKIRGLNGFHPGEWPQEAHDDFRLDQLAAFRAKWRLYRDNGTVAAYYAVGNRRQLLDWVRQDLQKALARLPADTYRICPCHSYAPRGQDDPRSVEERVTPGDIAGWVETDAFVREGLAPNTQAALTYLDTFQARTFQAREQL